MNSKDFFQKVYEVVKMIPSGRVSTYGLIAKYLGSAKSSRVVGYAMNASHQNSDIPAHRVVNLKTDSEFLHGYMLGLISGNDFLELTYSNNDIYNQSGSPTYVTEIKTFYELKFLEENKAITFISFRIN